MRTLSIGLIGNSRALAPFAGALSELAGGCVTDVAPGDRAVVFPAARQHGSGEGLLTEAPVAAAVLAAGAGNADLASLALRLGKDVIVLPPWRIPPSAVERLLDQAVMAGRQVLFSQPLAWSPDLHRALTHAGRAVRPRALRGTLVASDREAMPELLEQAACAVRLLFGARPDSACAAGGLRLASLHLYLAGSHGAQLSLSAGEDRRERSLTLIAGEHGRRLNLEGAHPAPDAAGDRVVPLRHTTVPVLRTPLGMEAVHLARCILHDETPLLGREEVLDVALTVEAARRSLLAMGAPVMLDTLLDAPPRPSRRAGGGGRPQLRLIMGGGHGAPGGATQPPLTVVS